MTTYLIVGIEDGTPVGPVRKSIHEHAGVKTDIVVENATRNIYGLDTQTDFHLLETVVSRHFNAARAHTAERRANLTQEQREHEDRRQERYKAVKFLEEEAKRRHERVDADTAKQIKRIRDEGREDIRKHGRLSRMKRDFDAPEGYGKPAEATAQENARLTREAVERTLESPDPRSEFHDAVIRPHGEPVENPLEPIPQQGNWFTGPQPRGGYQPGGIPTEAEGFVVNGIFRARAEVEAAAKALYGAHRSAVYADHHTSPWEGLPKSERDNWRQAATTGMETAMETLTWDSKPVETFQADMPASDSDEAWANAFEPATKREDYEADAAGPTPDDALNEIRINATSPDSHMPPEGFDAAMEKARMGSNAAAIQKWLNDHGDEAHLRTAGALSDARKKLEKVARILSEHEAGTHLHASIEAALGDEYKRFRADVLSGKTPVSETVSDTMNEIDHALDEDAKRALAQQADPDKARPIIERKVEDDFLSDGS